ncbi:MAG: hypothetical protein A2032_01525 [Chloroflexi bacterium RBG_19FT_COMBO_49_13]|nr:MAG: hypothetical protein A2032_01525 [Chloroflexi bacterium RBG_19FT_COMBO_49_13]
MKANSNRFNLGQSIVELALLLPVLLLLVVVTLDLGRGIYYYSVVYNAAREGARYGIIYPDNTVGIIEKAKNLAIGLDQDQLTVIPCECGKNCINDNSCPVNAINIIKVTVRYNFLLVTPMANLITGNDEFPLESTSMMAIER